MEVEVVISIAESLSSGEEHFLVRSSKAKDSIDTFEITITILHVVEVKIDTVANLHAELVSRFVSLEQTLSIRYSCEIVVKDFGTTTIDRARDVIGLVSAPITAFATDSN